MDRLDAMSLLLTVVEAGSLSAAGRKLGMPLATVSRKISDLETHLRTQLLTRSTRHMALTDAGQRYVAACRRILDQVEEAERTASGEYSAPRGDLIISAPIVFGRLNVLPIAVDFLRAYPSVNLRLMLVDRVLDLIEDHIDLALRIGALKDSSMKALRVGEIRSVVVASPSYLAERGHPTRPSALAGHCRVGFTGAQDQAIWRFQTNGAPEATAFQPRLTVSTAEAAIDAAVSGFGITRLLSYQVASAIKSGALVLLLEEFEPPPIPVNLVYADQRLIPLKLRAFLDYATPRLRTAIA
jgi:DNA-binding transcriptional LysR family regulator